MIDTIYSRIEKDFPALSQLLEEGQFSHIFDFFRLSNQAAIERTNAYLCAMATHAKRLRIAFTPAGGFARSVLPSLNLGAFDCLGIFDNNPQGKQDRFEGIPVYSTDSITEYPIDALIILSGEHYNELYDQVVTTKGLSADKVFVPFIRDDYKEAKQNVTAIRKINQICSRDESALSVLFVIGRISANQIKQSLYLRKQGIKTILLALENDVNWSLPFSSITSHFDYAFNTGGDTLSYLYVLQHLRPDIVHLTGHMYQNHFSLLATALSNAPVICEFYDVLSAAYNERLLAEQKGDVFARHQFRCEELLCKSVDGIIHKDHDIVIEILKHKYHLPQPVLQFQSYACDEFVPQTQPIISTRQHALRIVHVGGIHTQAHALDGYYLTGSLYEIAHILTEQGFYFDIFNVYDEGDNRFDKYRRLAEKNKRFGYFPPVSNDKVAGLISDYDLGWIAFDFSKTILKQDFYFASMGSKFFNYIEAGLPMVISHEHAYMAKLAEEHGIGIPVTLDNIKNLMEVIAKYDLLKMRRNVKRAREKLSMGRHIDKLVNFYRRIKALKQMD